MQALIYHSFQVVHAINNSTALREGTRTPRFHCRIAPGGSRFYYSRGALKASECREVQYTEGKNNNFHLR